MQGRLGEKLIADLIREIAQKKGSGLLRVTKGKIIKAIFFDSGAPVFAISNIADEQLDHRLIKSGHATSEQLEQAKKQEGKAHQLGRALVDMGLISEEELQKLVRQLVSEIIMSLFTWDQGDYAFDERVRAAHDIVFDQTADDCILEGSRRAASHENIARLILPKGAILAQGNVNGSRLASIKLSSVESYVLSRLDSPTPAAELAALTGLPEEQAREAVCTLISLGLVKRLGDESRENGDAADLDESTERLREEVSRKLHFFQNADLYEVLDVTKRASSRDIKSAYYQLAKKFHPDRYRQSEHAELRAKLEALFAKVTQAYEILSDPAQRAAYDERINVKPGSQPLQPFATAEIITPARERPPEPDPADHPELHDTTITAEEPAAIHAAPSAVSPAQQADFYYQKGRARYDAKDYYAAVQLLREAVRLDPNKPQYHYHLGVALAQNPRTRKEGEAHLIRASKLDPFNAQIRVRLGTLYKEAGLRKKAEAYFREALQIDPGNRTARRELGVSEKGSKKDGDTSIWKADLGTIAKKLFRK